MKNHTKGDDCSKQVHSTLPCNKISRALLRRLHISPFIVTASIGGGSERRKIAFSWATHGPTQREPMVGARKRSVGFALGRIL